MKIGDKVLVKQFDGYQTAIVNQIYNWHHGTKYQVKFKNGTLYTFDKSSLLPFIETDRDEEISKKVTWLTASPILLIFAVVVMLVMLLLTSCGNRYPWEECERLERQCWIDYYGQKQCNEYCAR